MSLLPVVERGSAVSVIKYNPTSVNVIKFGGKGPAGATADEMLKTAAALSTTLQQVESYSGELGALWFSTEGAKILGTNTAVTPLIVNAPALHATNVIDLQIDAVSKLALTSTGAIALSGDTGSNGDVLTIAGGLPTWTAGYTYTLPTTVARWDAALDATLRALKDGAGTDSALSISTAAASVAGANTAVVPLTVDTPLGQATHLAVFGVNGVPKLWLDKNGAFVGSELKSSAGVFALSNSGFFETRSTGGVAWSSTTSRGGPKDLILDRHATTLATYLDISTGGGIRVPAGTAVDPSLMIGTNGFGLYESASGRLGVTGVFDYRGTMGNSSKDPTADAPDDWVEIEIAGTSYFLPAFLA